MRNELPKSDDRCNTCEYFIQHYIWAYDQYVETNSGHCVQSKRSRKRRGTDPACDSWTAQTEEYKQRRTPLYSQPPERKPDKEYCVRVQVFEET